MEVAEILEEKDLATEIGSAQKSDEEECDWPPSFDKRTTELLQQSSGLLTEKMNNSFQDFDSSSRVHVVSEGEALKEETDEPSYEYENRANINCETEGNVKMYEAQEEHEKWMKQELEEAIRESERSTKLEHEHLKELAVYGAQNDEQEHRPEIPQRKRISRAVLARQRSEEAERQRMHDIELIEELREQNILRLAELDRTCDAIWHDETIATFEPVEGNRMGKRNSEDVKTIEEIRRRDENDKRIAIESIERHQRQLQDQQEQLSQLLDNAIVFLRNLDNDVLKKSPELGFSQR